MSRRLARCSRAVSRRGAALIAVLWVGALGGLLLLGVRHVTQVNFATAQAELAAVQAHWLARAGIEQAMAVLEDDADDVDSPLDYWYRDDGFFNEVELATGRFSVVAPPGAADDDTARRYGVRDLAGLLNVNVADRQTLERLPDMTPSIAASILDWIDQNSDAREGGAEAAYYQQLEFPYEIANRPMQTLHELRLVQGVTEEVFFGEDRNLNGILDPDEDTDGDGKLKRGLGGLVTVWGYERNVTSFGDRRLNLNRASEQQLRNRLNLSADLARGVVQARNNRQFRSVMDLLNVRPQAQRGRQQQSNRSRGGNTGTNNAAEEEEVRSFSLDWLEKNIDELTLTDDQVIDSRININTARQEVLLTLPQITEAEAEAIIEHRTGSAGPFESVGELRSSQVVSDRTWRAIAERVTVRSNVFEITGVGVSRDGIVKRITAVVDRGAEPMRVRYWYQGE